MNLEFVKLEGLGNDFVLFDCRVNRIRLTCDQIKKIGERRFGIGCDQILVLEASTKENADFMYSVFNSDGSRSEHCGNGLRCVGAYFKKFYKHENFITAQIGENISVIRFLQNNLYSVELEPPIFTPKEIGLRNMESSKSYFCNIKDETLEFGAVSLGNPHAVIKVEKSVKYQSTIYSQSIKTYQYFRYFR